MDAIRNLSGLDVVVLLLVILAAAGIVIAALAAADKAKSESEEPAHQEEESGGRRVVIVVDFDEAADTGGALYGLPYVARRPYVRAKPEGMLKSRQVEASEAWLESGECDYRGRLHKSLMTIPVENDPTGIF
jgi:hypothetical protein